MRLITVPVKVVLVDGLGSILVWVLLYFVLLLAFLAALCIAMVPLRLCSKNLACSNNRRVVPKKLAQLTSSGGLQRSI